MRNKDVINPYAEKMLAEILEKIELDPYCYVFKCPWCGIYKDRTCPYCMGKGFWIYLKNM